MAPHWDNLIKSESVNNRSVRFGYVNVDDISRDDVIKQYTINGDIEFTPTVLVYGADKSNPTEYVGDYEFDTLNEHVCTYCDDNGFSSPSTSKPTNPAE